MSVEVWDAHAEAAASAWPRSLVLSQCKPPLESKLRARVRIHRGPFGGRPFQTHRLEEARTSLQTLATEVS